MKRPMASMGSKCRIHGCRPLLLLLLLAGSGLHAGASALPTPAPAPRPLPPPPDTCAVTWYLDGIGDQTDVPIASVKETAPTDPVLINYDPGRDAFPGLLIKKGATGITESDPTKYQVWKVNNPTEPLNGPVNMYLWSAMKDFDQQKGGSFTVWLADCQASGGDCVPLATVTHTRTDWDTTDSGTWQEEFIQFGFVDHTFGPGRRLAVKLVVNNASEDDMWFAYDAVPYPSRLILADGTPPVIDCPANITVATDPGSCGAMVEYTLPTGSSFCHGTTTQQIAGLPSGSMHPVGTTTNTFQVMDVYGSTTTCSFEVTVQDVEPPVITTAPADMSVNIPFGGCTAITDWSAPTASDACGVVIDHVSGPTPGSQLPPGTYDVVYAITDPYGNSIGHTFTITVADEDPPVFVDCPESFTLVSTEGECGALAEWTLPTLLSDCDNVTLVQNAGPPMGSLLPIGITQIGYVATDVTGNSATCTFTITVNDEQAPAFSSCPADIFLSLTTGCDTLVEWEAPMADDECGSISIIQTAGPVSGSTLSTGSFTIAYSATDPSGNSSVCSFTVTVADNEAPGFQLCPADATIPNAPGECGAVAEWDVPLAADDCSDATVVQTTGPAPGTMLPMGTTTITYTATDAGGNSSTCSFTITVTDEEAPVAICTPAQLMLNAQGQASLTADQVDGGSTDNCGIASITVSPDQFTAPGTYTVILTVTDAAGNISDCATEVEVISPTAPTAICQDIIVSLNEQGWASITAQQLDGGSYDDIGIVHMAIDITSFDCSQIGVVPVTLTVTDGDGNNDSCIAMVTVVDDLPPITICLDVTVALVDGQASVAAAMIDGGTTDNCEVTGLSVSPSTFHSAGDHLVELVATDASGNTSVCWATVTVLAAPDEELPPLVIPSGFSPNGDGIADRWVIQGLERYPANKVIIFNRWGQELFQAEPYLNDWEGRASANAAVDGDLPAGVYFYRIDLDEDDQRTGYIQMNK